VIYGSVSLRKWEKIRPEYEAAMLQGNLGIEEPEQVLIDKFKNGYARMADRLGPPQVDLLLLPESPSPVAFQYDPAYSRVLEKLARRYALGLVFNNIRYLETAGDYYNSAYFLDGDGNRTGTYDKIHLVPFGEYIPLKRILSFAETITKDVGGFSPGKNYLVVRMRGRPASAMICFEAVFPGLVRRFVQNGSQLIINLTNDRWYGDSSAPYQHLAIARWRAVENRRYLLRAANSGITALIEPTGRIQSSAGLLQEAVCRGRFAFLAGVTPYTRYGDVFVFLCAIIIGSLLVRETFGGLIKRRN
jgi:apolipoprotein N-acyltransferase